MEPCGSPLHVILHYVVHATINNNNILVIVTRTSQKEGQTVIRILHEHLSAMKMHEKLPLKKPPHLTETRSSLALSTFSHAW